MIITNEIEYEAFKLRMDELLALGSQRISIEQMSELTLLSESVAKYRKLNYSGKMEVDKVFSLPVK